MLRRMMLLLALGSALPAVGCSREEVWRWELPDHFPVPAVPEDNPMSAAKVELGRHLFYDTRLSGDGDISRDVDVGGPAGEDEVEVAGHGSGGGNAVERDLRAGRG